MSEKETTSEVSSAKLEPAERKSAAAEALGGAPVGLPNVPARRVESTVAPTTPEPDREANPLFDDLPAEEIEAARTIQQLRTAFGGVIKSARSALVVGDALLRDESAALKAAAKREGFDLAAARKVLKDFSDLVDKHKPLKKG